MQKKGKQESKVEKKSISPPNISSTQRAIDESSLGSALSSQPKKEKKANMISQLDSDDSLSMSFIKGMTQLSDKKDSEQKSVQTKASQNTTTLPPVLDPNDPVVKQVKEITGQIKDDHKKFLSSLKDILQNNPMEYKCIQQLHKNFEQKLNRIEEKTCLDLLDCIKQNQTQPQPIEILQIPESLLKDQSAYLLCFKEQDYKQNLKNATTILEQEMIKIFDKYYERKIWLRKEGMSFLFDYLAILFQKIIYKIDQENSPGTKRTVTYEQFLKTMKGLGIIVD